MRALHAAASGRRLLCEHPLKDLTQVVVRQ